MSATFRQKLVASKIYENLRISKPKSLGKILRESGYSESVSRHPSLVTGSLGFQEEAQPFVDSLILIRENIFRVLEKDKSKIRDASYMDLINSVGKFTLLIIELEKLQSKLARQNPFDGWADDEIRSYAETGIKPERFRVLDEQNEII